jgi:transcriptional regulator with XRE-family HTH domain
VSSEEDLERVENVVGARIRRRRKRLGMSQETLAQLANVARKHMSRIETGKAEPGVWTLARIAGALETTYGRLLQGLEWVPNEHGPGHMKRGAD